MQLQVVEVAIGLFAAFFLVSLIASAFVEVLSNLLKKRSKDLSMVLSDMLSSGHANAIDFEGTSIYKAMQAASRRKRGPGAGPTSRKPSYISARSFADGVIEGIISLKTATTTTVAGVVTNLPPGPLKQRITTLQAEVGDDLIAIKAGLEGWFDDTMDRLEGAFKRWSQWLLLGFGLAIALSLNVSAVRIVDSLWNDATLRTAVADSAVDLTDRECPGGGTDCPPEEKIEQAIADLDGLGLPIGWTEGWSDESGAFGTLLGVAVTGVAVVLGAPFWFDLLTRLAGLRGGRGVPPKAANDRGSATVALTDTAVSPPVRAFSTL